MAGTIKLGTSDLTGQLVANLGPDGTFINLSGIGNGSLLLDTWGVATFSGTIAATAQQVTINGTGTVSSVNLPVSIPFKGTITSEVGTSNWTLSGTGHLQDRPDRLAERGTSS